MATIRHARIDDARAIAAIWNPLIRDGVETFNPVEKTQAEIAGMVEARQGAFWVAEDGKVSGFATFSQFRSGAGYRHTMEHTIIVAPTARGCGLGRQLMERAVAAARARDAHVLVACISGENYDGIAFHAATGFEIVGRMPEVGHKFGRWFDLVLMQRRL